MKFIKKFGQLVIILMLVAALVCIALISIKSIDTYKATIAQLEASVAESEDFIQNDIGELVDCYVVKKSVRVGDVITEDNVELVSVPAKIAYTINETEIVTQNEDGTTSVTVEKEEVLNVVTDFKEIDGKKFRVDLSQGSILLSDFYLDEPVKNDERYYEIILANYPTDIQVGDYVDIRIQFTYGQDFIALPHMRIVDMDLSRGMFKFIMSEAQMATYNSMLLDSAMYESVIISMLKYVDSSSQTAAAAYYPINNNIKEIMSINPNILSLVTAEMELEREQLNALLGGDIESFDDQQLAEVSREIALFRTEVQRSIASSISDRLREEERLAAEAARNQ